MKLTLQKNCMILKIGVLGIGENTEKHLSILKEFSFFEISGLFDPDLDKAADLAIKMKVPVHDDFASLLDVSDIIFTDEPFKGFFDLLTESVRKLRHIYIEKPTALTTEETNILFKLSEEARLKIQVSYPERFNPALVAARSYFRNPMFIETHRLSVYNELHASLPVVSELMVHDLDILLNAIKSNVKKISASGVAIVSNTFDIANARIEFDNGCVANVTASRISLNNMCKSRFFQKDAYLTVDMLNNNTSIIRINSDNHTRKEKSVTKIGDKEVYFEKPDIIKKNIFTQQMISFYNSISNDTRPLVSIEDSYKTLLTAERVLEKMMLTSNCL